MNIKEALVRLFDGGHLDSSEMTSVMQELMTGQCTDAQTGALLAALRMKGETVDEVAGAAIVMRQLAAGVAVDEPNAIDIVGTGGDATHTFNVSTCCSIVAAAAGIKVAKHGNRSVSSKSGAADLLETAGVNINLTPHQVATCIDRVGVGFMFAPLHHSAMKHAIGQRREMGVRTIFNLLGPMTNPAGVKRQLLGVYGKEWVRPIAEVLKQLGSEHVLVVHGDNGMDEISISGTTTVAELKNGAITEFTLDPKEFGMSYQPLSDIQVPDSAASLTMIHSVLDNKPGAALDIVRLNSGAAVYIGGGAENIEAGVEKATSAIASGAAKATLSDLVKVSQELAG